LKVPVLEELAVLEGPDRPNLFPVFLSLIDRSSCSLRRLCLVAPAADTATKILKYCPSITELFIVHDDDRKDEINALILALTSPSITPHLCLIFFGCESRSCLDGMAYLEMLKSRRTAENCALKSAALLADGPKPEPVTICGLQTLRQEGLDLLLLKGVAAGDEIDLGPTQPHMIMEL
jgi:hypothetical protein